MKSWINEIRRLFLLACIAVAAMAAPAGAETETDATGRYQGVLTCDGCVDSRYRIDLFSDGVYYLHVAQSRSDAGHDDVGRWIWSTDKHILVLKGREKLARYFMPDGPGQLKPYEAGQGVLQRDDALSPLIPSGTYTGLFSYMADAPSFEDCASGRRMPVEMADAYIDLERAYLKMQRTPGEKLMTQVRGALKMLPPMEGDRLVPTLHVDKSLGFRPGVSCPAHFDNAPLSNTDWLLTQLGQQRVEIPPATVTGKRALPHVPHLIFGRSGTLTGAGGCNRLNGNYALSGDGIAFDSIRTTRMACANGMETEQRLLAALESTSRWRIAGDLLELLDSGGVLLARFAAVRK